MGKICPICGCLFYRADNYSKDQWEKKKACSVKCAVKARSTIKLIPCAVCSKVFKPCRKDITCCSVACSKKNRKIPTEDKVCVECGKVFSRTADNRTSHNISIEVWKKRKCCSYKCRNAYFKKNSIGFQNGHVGYKNSGNFKKGIVPWNKGNRNAKPRILKGRPSGKEHHWWKGGTTALRKQIQNLQKYRDWRKAVYERDNYTCLHCKKRGGRLQADHVVPFSALISLHEVKTKEDAERCLELWDISNGQTLCVACHMKTDTYGARAARFDLSLLQGK